MTYREHMLLNFGIAAKLLGLAVLHFVHGVVDAKWTSHEHWFPTEGKKLVTLDTEE